MDSTPTRQIRPARPRHDLRDDHGQLYAFALHALTPPLGPLLCGAVWTLAAAGIALKLACYHPFQRVSVALYLGMGWLLLPVIRAFARALHEDILLFCWTEVPFLRSAPLCTREHACRFTTLSGTRWR